MRLKCRPKEKVIIGCPNANWHSWPRINCRFWTYLDNTFLKFFPIALIFLNKLLVCHHIYNNLEPRIIGLGIGSLKSYIFFTEMFTNEMKFSSNIPINQILF